MKEISLNNQSSPVEAMTTAAVKALLQLLTSAKTNIFLLALALVTVILWMIDESLNVQAAAGTTAWILHFASLSAIDIYRKGGEL